MSIFIKATLLIKEFPKLLIFLLKASFKVDINQTPEEIKDFSYEESMAELDILLSQLQNDSFPIEELQACYLKAKMYLAHCDNLLKTIEQEVLQINSDELENSP